MNDDGILTLDKIKTAIQHATRAQQHYYNPTILVPPHIYKSLYREKIAEYKNYSIYYSSHHLEYYVDECVFTSNGEVINFIDDFL